MELAKKTSEFTEEEKVIAGRLTSDPNIMKLLKRVYCPERSRVRNELEAMMLLDDAEYGRQMKALVMAEKHFADAHAKLWQIARKEKQPHDVNGIAPK